MRKQASNPPLDEGRRAAPLKVRWLGLAAGAAISLAPVCAYAGDAPSPYSVPLRAPPANGYLYPGASFFSAWLDMVEATQKAQPRWMTPLVTVTPRLEQEFRADFYHQKNGPGPQGNGQNIISYGGPGGARLEFVPAWNWEVIVATPPWATASGPRGKAEGVGDWPAFLVKYRLISANKDNGDYIVTAFFQMSDPLGTPGQISNNVLTAQPTLAFGKGWGDFDIQSTVSVQIPVDGIQSANFTAQQNMTRFGDPILWNTAFQYHFAEYFWPELEVNYTFWPNGIHKDLNQVLLTPGIIFGRFKIGQDTPTRPINLIIGAGYQFAVTSDPVVKNNWVATLRVTF